MLRAEFGRGVRTPVCHCKGASYSRNPISTADAYLYNLGMQNQIPQQLKHWYPLRDKHQWVLGCVYKVNGPSYRKPGAMMFFNDLGEQLGLLSGGCLESDIQKYASQVMRSQQSVTICYDGSDEDDMSFLLGIGCGGTIHILLQPLSADNQYLQLPSILQALENNHESIFLQKIPAQDGSTETRCLANDHRDYPARLAQIGDKNGTLVEQDNQKWLATHIKPPIHLLVVGGGVDACPVVNLAVSLGWQVSLCDPRPANARRDNFMSATSILRCAPDKLPDHQLFGSFDAAIVMTHNMQMDADALASLQKSSVKYLALLGPASRKQQVMAMAELDQQSISTPIAGPAGLCLGGEIPEEIALSILAECLAVLNQTDASSLSKLL